jgi:hypothetical protein
MGSGRQAYRLIALAQGEYASRAGAVIAQRKCRAGRDIGKASGHQSQRASCRNGDADIARQDVEEVLNALLADGFARPAARIDLQHVLREARAEHRCGQNAGDGLLELRQAADEHAFGRHERVVGRNHAAIMADGARRNSARSGRERALAHDDPRVEQGYKRIRSPLQSSAADPARSPAPGRPRRAGRPASSRSPSRHGSANRPTRTRR